MLSEELLTLVKKIQQHNYESKTLEVKAAVLGCPTRLFDTLSAFSNQDEGGILIFGIEESKSFSVCGVYDLQDLQKKVTEQCKQMEPILRPLFTECEIDGKMVLSAEIPGIEVERRPVFYRGVGRLKGSYLRVGESDELMSEYEIYSYDAFRRRLKDDLRVVETNMNPFFDPELMAKYLTSIKKDRKNIAEYMKDSEILEMMGVMINEHPTLAGLLAFSKYPQALYPQYCITAVVVPGLELGVTGSDGERFLANQRLTGPVHQMLDDAVDFIRRNSRVKTIIDDQGRRNDKPEFPLKDVREAILNALVHRDYSIHTESVPIRIVMYSDRMEIINSGGLYGNLSIDALGRMRPETRNPILANLLEILCITENRYSGIPTIRSEFKNAGLPSPKFVVNKGEFIVTFYNGKDSYLVEETSVDFQTSLVSFCQTPRSRKELIAFTGFTPYYTMTKLIPPLIEKGLIHRTIPEKPRSRSQLYFSTKEGKLNE